MIPGTTGTTGMGMSPYRIILPSENEAITALAKSRNTHGLTTNLVCDCTAYLQEVDDGIDG